MHYITFPIKLYTNLTVPASVILSAIESSLLIGCTTRDERATYVYGLVSHVLTTVSIRNNIMKLQSLGLILPDLTPATHIEDVTQIKTINRIYGTPGRKHQDAIEETTNLINSLQDAH